MSIFVKKVNIWRRCMISGIQGRKYLDYLTSWLSLYKSLTHWTKLSFFWIIMVGKSHSLIWTCCRTFSLIRCWSSFWRFLCEFKRPGMAYKRLELHLGFESPAWIEVYCICLIFQKRDEEISEVSWLGNSLDWSLDECYYQQPVKFLRWRIWYQINHVYGQNTVVRIV